MQCLKWGSDVGEPEIEAAHRGQKVDGPRPARPSSFHRLWSRGSICRPVVKLLSKRWWIPVGARLEGPKLEPEGPRADVRFPTADQGFSSIQGTLFGFYGI